MGRLEIFETIRERELELNVGGVYAEGEGRVLTGKKFRSKVSCW